MYVQISCKIFCISVIQKVICLCDACLNISVHSIHQNRRIVDILRDCATVWTDIDHSMNEWCDQMLIDGLWPSKTPNNSLWTMSCHVVMMIANMWGLPNRSWTPPTTKTVLQQGPVWWDSTVSATSMSLWCHAHAEAYEPSCVQTNEHTNEPTAWCDPPTKDSWTNAQCGQWLVWGEWAHQRWWERCPPQGQWLDPVWSMHGSVDAIQV